MFMSGMGNTLQEVWCPKHQETVDMKTCLLCEDYTKRLFTRKCHWKHHGVLHTSGKRLICHLLSTGVLGRRQPSKK